MKYDLTNIMETVNGLKNNDNFIFSHYENDELKTMRPHLLTWNTETRNGIEFNMVDQLNVIVDGDDYKVLETYYSDKHSEKRIVFWNYSDYGDNDGVKGFELYGTTGENDFEVKELRVIYIDGMYNSLTFEVCEHLDEYSVRVIDKLLEVYTELRESDFDEFSYFLETVYYHYQDYMFCAGNGDWFGLTDDDYYDEVDYDDEWD